MDVIRSFLYNFSISPGPPTNIAKVDCTSLAFVCLMEVNLDFPDPNSYAHRQLRCLLQLVLCRSVAYYGSPRNDVTLVATHLALQTAVPWPEATEKWPRLCSGESGKSSRDIHSAFRSTCPGLARCFEV